MKPTIDLPNAQVFLGSCLDVLPTLADNSVDSIVTDPPYELGFMGKSWDASGVAYNSDVWRECLRVLKPGGHLLAFGGSRTWHRLAVAIEDAGFEMRDSIAWLYGSGFPKSHNISKAIDKLHGAEREVVGSRPLTGNGKTMKSGFHQPDGSGAGETVKQDVFEFTAPATNDAKKWDGWGTALKPAFEPVVVARKPLVGTVAENVLKYGTGGLNIDATRIGTGTGEKRIVNYPDIRGNNYGQDNEAYAERATMQREIIDQGRWPANIILDEFTAKLLDEQSGQVKGGTWNNTAGARHFNNDGKPTDYVSKGSNKSVGGASRFFYVAKANKKDRNEGLDNLVSQESAGKGNGLGRICAICGASILKPCECPDRTFVNPPKQNFHPTVKPTALMQYLIRLVTPPNGIVLDPFTGSGSTGKAAILENFKFIGIELTAEYLPIIEGRLIHAIDTQEEAE